MTIVTNWPELVDEAVRKFPETKRAVMLAQDGDMGALMRHVADAHHLTFAEAAEVVTFRLPQFLEATRLAG